MSAVVLTVFWVLFQLYICIDGITLDKYYERNEFLNFYKTLTQTQGAYNNIFIVNQIFEGLDSQFNISEKCREDLLTFREFSVNSSELWSLMMLDASGSFQSGLFQGNLAHLGDWDQCYSIKSEYLSPAVCSAKVILPGGQLQTSSNIYHNAPIIFTMCLVSTCSENDLETVLKPWFSSHNMTVNFYCYPKQDSSNVLIIVIVSIFILLLSSSSCYDIWKCTNNQEVTLNLWNIFSVRRNMSQLCTKQSPISSGTLSALFGLKFLSQLMVIFYHVQSFNLSLSRPLANKFEYTEMLESWHRSYYIGLSLSVDTYLVMSGFLISYTSLNRPSKFRNIALYYLHRYIRLTPSLIAVILIYVLAGNKVFYGPQGVSRVREVDICRSNWWTNLLYINNYTYLMEMCLAPTWYLAVDMQLYLLSPALLFLVTSCKNKRLVYSIISALFMMAIIIPSVYTFLFSLPADEFFVVSKDDHFRYMTKFYTPTETRFGPWLIGFLVGMLIKTEGMKTFFSNKYYNWACWLLSGLFMATCLNVTVMAYHLNDRNLYVNALYNSLKRNLWSLSIGWLIFACATGTAGGINRFLSWNVFEPLGKLSYAAYLIHSIIVFSIMFESNVPTYFSHLKQVVILISSVTISYLLAIVLYVTVEAPACNLDKLFLSDITCTPKPSHKGSHKDINSVKRFEESNIHSYKNLFSLNLNKSNTNIFRRHPHSLHLKE